MLGVHPFAQSRIMSTFVLVHGAFHGPWCFDLVIDRLGAQGSTAIAPKLPLTSLADDTAAVTAALDADSDGEEGKFYVWTKAEIDAALGHDAELTRRYHTWITQQEAA